MRTQARARGATVALVAALLLVTAWAAVGDRTLPQVPAQHRAIQAAAPERTADHAVVASIQVVSRIARSRLGPLWSLAGLTAGLAALLARRRRAGSPKLAIAQAFRRGNVARRAPPLASLA